MAIFYVTTQFDALVKIVPAVAAAASENCSDVFRLPELCLGFLNTLLTFVG